MRYDFPTEWPSLPNEISLLLQGPNLNTGLCSTLSLNIITKMKVLEKL